MSQNVYIFLCTLMFVTLSFSSGETNYKRTGNPKKDKVQTRKPGVTICKGEREALLEKLRLQRAIARSGLSKYLQIAKEETSARNSASGFELPKDHQLLWKKTIMFPTDTKK